MQWLTKWQHDAYMQDWTDISRTLCLRIKEKPDGGWSDMSCVGTWFRWWALFRKMSNDLWTQVDIIVVAGFNIVNPFKRCWYDVMHEDEHNLMLFHIIIEYIVDSELIVSMTCDCYTWWESVVACTSDRVEHDMNMIRLSSVDTHVVVHSLVWLRS